MKNRPSLGEERKGLGLFVGEHAAMRNLSDDAVAHEAHLLHAPPAVPER
jgi:hypothetical protein